MARGEGMIDTVNSRFDPAYRVARGQSINATGAVCCCGWIGVVPWPRQPTAAASRVAERVATPIRPRPTRRRPPRPWHRRSTLPSCGRLRGPLRPHGPPPARLRRQPRSSTPGRLRVPRPPHAGRRLWRPRHGPTPGRPRPPAAADRRRCAPPTAAGGVPRNQQPMPQGCGDRPSAMDRRDGPRQIACHAWGTSMPTPQKLFSIKKVAAMSPV